MKHGTLAILTKPHLRLHIGPRIWLGFGLVLIALFAVAVIGHLGLQRSSDQFQAFTQLSAQSSAILDIERRMVDLQRRVLAFTYSGYMGIVTRIRGLVIELRRQLEHVSDEVADQEQHRILQRMSLLFELYANNFEQAVDERLRHEHLLREQLAPLTQRAQNLIDALQHTPAATETTIATDLKDSLVDLLFAHQYTLAFEGNPDSALIQKTLSRLNALDDRLDGLRRQTQGAPRQQISVLMGIMEEYRTAFSGMVQSTRTYLYLVYVVMAGEAAELNQLAARLKKRTLSQQSELRQHMTRDIDLTRGVTLLVSGLAVLLAVALSWRIARGITKPLIAMSDTLTHISEGRLDPEMDSDIQIPYRERSDEIGIIAKAADAFREEVIKKQRAEAANRSKSLFLAHMSHELRTPLNAILGFSELIGQMADTPSEQRQYLQIINRSGTHLLGMINDILDMSKIEAGQYAPRIENFDLWQMVDDVSSMFALRAEQAGIAFILERAEEVPRNIRSDEGKLRQILINLLGNAIKFTKQGHVLIRVRAERTTEEASLLVCEVEDSGVGIAPDRIASVFEPFVQAEPQSQDGTGLGLAICARFAEMLGGDIALESALDEGSRFRLKVPFETALEQDLPPEAKTCPLARPVPGQPIHRVLSVEDNANNRLLLERLLSPMGVELRSVASGQEGIEAFSAWKPNLILMDIRMPGMDGLEATRRIRALPHGSECRIVAITASTFKSERERILAAGFDDFLSKPYRNCDIQGLLERHLGLKFEKSVDTYTEAEIAVSPETHPLPDELKQRLQEALVIGDSEQIATVLRRLEPSHPQIVRMLDRWVSDYQYSRILSWLDDDA